MVLIIYNLQIPDVRSFELFQLIRVLASSISPAPSLEIGYSLTLIKFVALSLLRS